MKRDLFENFLIVVREHTERVAKEKVAFCSSIEKEFKKDLDIVARNDKEICNLLESVKTIKRANPRRYEVALMDYFDFAKRPFGKSITSTDIVRISAYFYRECDDMLPSEYFDILPRMEGEYECILGFGRDEFFRKACNEKIERIPVILSPEIKKETYKPSDAEIAKQICELFKAKKCNVSEQEVMAILQQSKVGITHTILGEFVKADEPYIILYYKAIGGNTREEKVAGLANVLAHEYMHYMEYRYCLSKGVASSENKKLSEAMADFFGVLYILKYGYYASDEKKVVAKEQYDVWERWFGSGWPYAEALHFYTVDGITMNFSTQYCDYEMRGNVEKLLKVFDNSYKPDIAYDILLHE